MTKLQSNMGKIKQTCYAHAIHLSVVDFLLKKTSRKSIEQQVLEIDDDNDREAVDAIVDSSLEDCFKSLISKILKIINAFSHSGVLSDELRRYQCLDKVEILGLKAMENIPTIIQSYY